MLQTWHFSKHTVFYNLPALFCPLNSMKINSDLWRAFKSSKDFAKFPTKNLTLVVPHGEEPCLNTKIICYDFPQVLDFPERWNVKRKANNAVQVNSKPVFVYFQTCQNYRLLRTITAETSVMSYQRQLVAAIIRVLRDLNWQYARQARSRDVSWDISEVDGNSNRVV